jgi:drug/metabolite transporter (DMT)-like permease
MAVSLSFPALGRGSLSGMALAAAAFALLTSVDTVFKLVAAGGHPAYQILLINACFALVPILIWTMTTGGLSRLATARLPQHMARGAASVMAAFAAIYAYSRLPLTDFYAIVFAGPLVVTAMAAFWLGETIEPARWWAIALGFVGILVVTNPLASTAPAAHGAAVLGRFAAFISMFCYALSVIMVRRMRGGETNMSFSFYGYLVSALVGGALSLFCGAPNLHGADIAHLALSGTLGGIASICMMTAYHRTPVALVAPFQYTQIIWGALAGYVFWQHVPSGHLIAGSVIVAASGMYVIYREMRSG